MGVPYFQVRELIEKHRIVVFSSNYARMPISLPG